VTDHLTCAVCGIRHNHWMTCRTARRLAAQSAELAEPGPPAPIVTEPLFGEGDTDDDDE
jgi:hypothetical protein